MRLKKVVFIGLLFILISSFADVHKYYISLTQIDYIKDSESVQITMNLFLDDFELSLNKTFDQNFNLNTKEELENSNDYIQKYLQDHFQLKIDDIAQNTNYLGREYEGDIVYLYIEIENVKTVSTVEVKNNMLIGFFPDQQNLVKLKINDKFDSLLLTKKNDKGLLKF
ncbi:MAG TPA: DUF6702 family protein [Flavobacteriaceae bacterium]|nr:DUF6702 family protein [Flavobacteriaceae bacterium]